MANKHSKAGQLDRLGQTIPPHHTDYTHLPKLHHCHHPSNRRKISFTPTHMGTGRTFSLHSERFILYLGAIPSAHFAPPQTVWTGGQAPGRQLAMACCRGMPQTWHPTFPDTLPSLLLSHTTTTHYTLAILHQNTSYGNKDLVFEWRKPVP